MLLARKDLEDEERSRIRLVKAIRKRCHKGAHPSKDFLGQSIGETEDEAVIGANYKDSGARTALGLGVGATTEILNEYAQTEPMTVTWQRELSGIHNFVLPHLEPFVQNRVTDGLSESDRN